MVQGKPVTDVCDTDVMDKCLQTKGLDTFGIGKVHQCLLNAGASDIAAADAERLQAESQVSLSGCNDAGTTHLHALEPFQDRSSSQKIAGLVLGTALSRIISCWRCKSPGGIGIGHACDAISLGNSSWKFVRSQLGVPCIICSRLHKQ